LPTRRRKLLIQCGNSCIVAFDFGFGSWHPGVCQFLIGDGAVRSISTTTPLDPILAALGDASDGVSVSLP
jgi:hypothetical protein